MSSRKEKLKNIFSQIKEKIFPQTLYIDLLWSMYQDLCFSVVLQFTSLNAVTYSVETINYIIFSINFLALTLPIFLAYLIYSNKYQKIAAYLTKDLKFSYYQIMLYFRKFYYTLIIGTLQSSPNIQIAFILAFHLFFLLMIIKLKPYNEDFMNYKDGFQSLFFLISHILVLCISNQVKDDNNEVTKLSWVILSIFTLIISLEVILCFKQIYISVKETYIKYKNNKKKQQTIVPVNQIQKLNQKQIVTLDNISINNKIERNNLQDQTDALESPSKFESRNLISYIMDYKDSSQTNIKQDLGSPFKRVLRKGRNLQDLVTNNKIQENYSLSTMLKIQQSQSEILADGFTNRCFQNLQSYKSSRTCNTNIIEDKSQCSSSNNIPSYAINQEEQQNLQI